MSDISREQALKELNEKVKQVCEIYYEDGRKTGLFSTKGVSTEQLEKMYERFRAKLWREHEEVCGNSMIEIGYAEQFLSELLMEFGCWDGEEHE